MGKRKKVIMANKFTIRVTKTAFYNGGLVYPNEIIKNYKGETIPSWATLANGNDAPVKKDEAPEASMPEKCKPCYADGKTPSEADCAECKAKEANANSDKKEDEAEVVVAGDGGVHEIPADEAAKEGEAGKDETPAEQTEEALMEEYNALLDEAVEKNILLEDADKKTIVEQIAELKILLGKE